MTSRQPQSSGSVGASTSIRWGELLYTALMLVFLLVMVALWSQSMTMGAQSDRVLSLSQACLLPAAENTLLQHISQCGLVGLLGEPWLTFIAQQLVMLVVLALLSYRLLRAYAVRPALAISVVLWLVTVHLHINGAAHTVLLIVLAGALFMRYRQPFAWLLLIFTLFIAFLLRTEYLIGLYALTMVAFIAARRVGHRRRQFRIFWLRITVLGLICALLCTGLLFAGWLYGGQRLAFVGDDWLQRVGQLPAALAGLLIPLSNSSWLAFPVALVIVLCIPIFFSRRSISQRTSLAPLLVLCAVPVFSLLYMLPSLETMLPVLPVLLLLIGLELEDWISSTTPALHLLVMLLLAAIIGLAAIRIAY